MKARRDLETRINSLIFTPLSLYRKKKGTRLIQHFRLVRCINDIRKNETILSPPACAINYIYTDLRTDQQILKPSHDSQKEVHTAHHRVQKEFYPSNPAQRWLQLLARFCCGETQRALLNHFFSNPYIPCSSSSFISSAGMYENDRQRALALFPYSSSINGSRVLQST